MCLCLSLQHKEPWSSSKTPTEGALRGRKFMLRRKSRVTSWSTSSLLQSSASASTLSTTTDRRSALSRSRTFAITLHCKETQYSTELTWITSPIHVKVAQCIMYWSSHRGLSSYRFDVFIFSQKRVVLCLLFLIASFLQKGKLCFFFLIFFFSLTFYLSLQVFAVVLEGRNGGKRPSRKNYSALTTSAEEVMSKVDKDTSSSKTFVYWSACAPLVWRLPVFPMLDLWRKQWTSEERRSSETVPDQSYFILKRWKRDSASVMQFADVARFTRDRKSVV